MTFYLRALSSALAFISKAFINNDVTYWMNSLITIHSHGASLYMYYIHICIPSVIYGTFAFNRYFSLWICLACYYYYLNCPSLKPLIGYVIACFGNMGIPWFDCSYITSFVHYSLSEIYHKKYSTLFSVRVIICYVDCFNSHWLVANLLLLFIVILFHYYYIPYPHCTSLLSHWFLLGAFNPCTITNRLILFILLLVKDLLWIYSLLL